MMRALVLGLWFLLTWGAWAQDLQPIPPLKTRVTDLTGSLSRVQSDPIERRLAEFETRKGSQVAVLLVQTTEPETIEQFAIRVVDAWQLGRKGTDDGVLLLMAMRDRTLRIEVGRGLEGALNDATAKRIIAEQIVPRLRASDVVGAVDVGVVQILKVIDGEALPPPPQGRSGKASRGMSWDTLLPLLLVFVFVGGAILRRILGRVFGSAVTGALAGALCYLLSGVVLIAAAGGVLALIFNIAGISGPGALWSTGGRGGWGSGGGFGGGGGGFGGGGASGRW